MGASQLTAEYRKQGYYAALEMAEQLVALEAEAEAAREKREQAKREAEKKADNDTQTNRSSGQFIQGSQSGVGGGGRAILIGGPMLSESKKQSSLLTEIRDKVAEPPTIEVTGNVTAVIGNYKTLQRQPEGLFFGYT